MKFEIEKTDFLTFYKTYINVCIYTSGLIKDKFKVDFDIKLIDLRNKKEFSQKCEIHLENKRKGVYSSVIVRTQPQLKNNNLNNKIINCFQTITNPKVEHEHLNKINKKDKNKKDIIELNKNISVISDLKNLLTEKEKRINEEIYKNQELKEELLGAGAFLREKIKQYKKRRIKIKFYLKNY